MAKYRYSVNPKLNALLQDIEDDLMSMEETSEVCISEMKRYQIAFPNEPDYNIAQYGRLLVSAYQVRQLNQSCGYAPSKLSDDKIWHKYLQQVGVVVRTILKNQK